MSLIKLSRQYFDLFSAQDLVGLSEMFDDSITLRDWSLSAEGKDKVLECNKMIFQGVDSIVVSPSSIYESGNTIIAEISILINEIEEIYVVDILRFNNLRKIVSIRAYKG